MRICEHFNECGGCRLQDIPYAEQLRNKEDRVRGLMSSYEINAELKPINFSREWFYRNKMEFTFACQEGLVCGLYSKKNKGEVVDIKECLIFSDCLKEILKAIKTFVKNKNYTAYNKYSHKGFLRNLIVRETKFTNKIMIGLVTSSDAGLDKEEFIKILLSLKLDSVISSIYWIINDSLSDAVLFERKELLYGEACVEECLSGLTFGIGIDTFFQVNPRMIVDFYTKIRNYIDSSSSQSVLDLFCGVGSIGIFISSKAKFIWGVEISKEIVDMAWRNAKINNIKNISFFVSDVRRFLNTQGTFYKDTDVLIVNPPRCGLSNKIIRAILRLNSEIIIYSHHFALR